MEKFWKWLVQSSIDPEKVGMTVKGILIGVIPAVLFAAPYLHVNIVPEQLQAAAELVREIIVTSLGLISGLMAVYGFIRKLANTVRDAYSKQ